MENKELLRLEVIPKFNVFRNETLSDRIFENENIRFKISREGRFYKINTSSSVTTESLNEVFSDVVVEDCLFENSHKVMEDFKFSYVVERSFKPGVTDNPGRSAKDALSLRNVEGDVYSGKLYFIDTRERNDIIEKISNKYLGNSLIEDISVYSREEFLQDDRFNNISIPNVVGENRNEVNIINLDLSDIELEELSVKNCLALTLQEMKFIRDYFIEMKEDRISKGLPLWPTDVELEVIAQTWSEHCKHKIFASKINYVESDTAQKKIGSRVVDSLYKTLIKGATTKVKEENSIDWLVSVFSDNAGIVRYDENIDLCIKVETHNSPSALDPYGGALTGILGVNRDILGCGLGARPIANTDVFCFADPKLPSLGDEQNLPKGLMNPSQILEGVHLGVEDGGNKSGIPTVNGAMYFDNDYAGKPLVYVGTVGAMPRKLADGRRIEEKKPNVGDRIIMLGGEVGADGIHGATFSSLELDENSPVTAVQIGDPLTQKRVLDFLITARDKGLYTSITDNGAGGLSSSVGEMAEFTNGAKLYLDKCPMKYAGLKPFEIMISESQERMTLAVSESKLADFLNLAKRWNVLATDIGEFTDSGHLEVFYNVEKVADLNLEFLHNMLPQMELNAFWDGPKKRNDWFGNKKRKVINSLSNDLFTEMISKIISTPNVASKEKYVRRYDHEVQASTNIKPFTGKDGDGVNNSGGIWLYPHGGENYSGALIGCGMNPRISLYDPYYMAQYSVDEAVRNIICSGANPNYISLLDNFCWPDPVESKKNTEGQYRLAQLVRASIGLYDACLDYGTPLVSGKDSMKNDFRGKNRKDEDLQISVLPTLLVTSLGKYDVRHKVESGFVENKDVIIVGNDSLGLGGSEFNEYFDYGESDIPLIDTKFNSKLYKKIYELISNDMIHSCHDISDGGLITTILESCFANNLGANIDVSNLGESLVEVLFSETPGRFVISVDKNKSSNILKELDGFNPYRIGETQKNPEVLINNSLNIDVVSMKALWKGVF